MSSYLATSGFIITWEVPCLISGKLSESPNNLFLDIFKYLILLVLSDSLQNDFTPIVTENQSKGTGEDPWLFADGSFNPDWDASGLDMDLKYQFKSDANRYEKARREYERDEGQKKFNQNVSKIWKFINEFEGNRDNK